MFGSLTTLGLPFNYPGVYNLLELDPGHAVQLQGFIPIGPFGGQCQLALPLIPWQDIEIAFQPVILDPALNLAFAAMATAVQGAAPALPGGNLEWSGGFSRKPDRYTIKFKGVPGANVRVLINGGQKGVGMAVLDGNGEATVVIPVTMKKGDSVTIEQNGTVVRSWTRD